MPSSIPASEYRFSGYRLDTGARKLFDPDGRPLRISSRAFDALVVLLQHRGETLAKDRLIEAIWPDVVVEENNLNQAISSLRKCLADSTSAPRFIQTIPGRGYRFIAPVDPPEYDGSDAGGAHASPTPENHDSTARPRYAGADEPCYGAPPASGPPELDHGLDHGSPRTRPSPKRARQPKWLASRALGVVSIAFVLLVAGAIVLSGDDAADADLTFIRPAASTAAADAADAARPVPLPGSVAVMPLTELNQPTDDGLFAIGLHDEMIRQMASIRSLKVISRENVLALADQNLPLEELGRLLSAQTVLTGTILYLGERARVGLQMFAPSTGIVLWASTYEVDMAEMTHMLAIQSDIATNVATALEAEVTAREREVIGTPPTDSFQAYRYLLAAKNAYYFQNYAQTWSLARQAIRLDESFIDAHYYFSYVNTVLTAVPLEGLEPHDHYRLAMESAMKVIQLAPHDNRGYSLRAAALGTRGEWEQVAEEVARLATMGVSLSEMKFYAPVLLSLGDFEGAIEILEANLMTEPVNLYGRGFLMAAYEMAGQPDRARREYQLGEELNPIWWGDTVNLFLALGRSEPLRDIDQLPISEPLKALLANLDDRHRVMQALADYRAREDKMSAESVYYSAIAAQAGADELALELMREALEGVWLSFHWLWLPVFDEVRQLAGFRQLLIDSGIVAYWDSHGWPEVCRRGDGDGFRCDWRAYDALPARRDD